jgi:hypothetical protein
MKIKFNAVVFFIAAIAFCQCKDDVDLPYQPLDSYTKIYMPQAVNGPVTKVLPITDSLQVIVFGAAFGGVGYPTEDVSVSFSIDKEKIDSFNTANHSSYELLPENTYSLSGTQAVIAKGQLTTPALHALVKTKGEDAMPAFKTYILPISITKTNAKINEAIQTTFFLVSSQPDLNDYPVFSRTDWQIIDKSSEEANGEGPNNGKAIFALDGDKNTFWHTQWQGASPAPPHYLTIDMGSEKEIHGLSFVGRQADGGGKPNEVNVLISTDNIAWKDAGSFNLQNNKNEQPVFLPTGFGQSARYFKVVINSCYGGAYAQIAELNAF